MRGHVQTSARRMELATMLSLLCAILAGCPPHKPTPVVQSTDALTQHLTQAGSQKTLSNRGVTTVDSHHSQD